MPTALRDDTTVLVLPGLHGSGPLHWQSIWERRNPEFRRVEQARWSEPTLGEWATALDRAVRAARSRVVLVAHSLGCALAVQWARAGAVERVGGALLVAPADVDALPGDAPRSFTPMPLERLPFRTVVAASSTDPFCSVRRARHFAAAWDARFVELGDAGHVNVASGHGPWSEGLALLEGLRAEVALDGAAHAAGGAG